MDFTTPVDNTGATGSLVLQLRNDEPFTPGPLDDPGWLYNGIYSNFQHPYSLGTYAYPYTSGMISTDLPVDTYKFGYFEARIKFPYSPGYHSAFWVAGGPSSTSTAGYEAAEIDIC